MSRRSDLTAGITPTRSTRARSGMSTRSTQAYRDDNGTHTSNIAQAHGYEDEDPVFRPRTAHARAYSEEDHHQLRRPRTAYEDERRSHSRHFPSTQTHRFEDDYSSYRDDQYGSSHDYRAQTQRHTFRSAQASKQMVLEVFENCITMLEELESREQRRQGRTPLSRSEIYLPSQSSYDDKTIQRKLDTQLLLLQSQLDSCDTEIKTEVREEMTDSTLQWASGREDRSLPNGQTDKYAGKLLEVLETGTTKHPKAFYKSPTISESGMRNAMGALMIGHQKRDKLDEGFRANSSKKASKLRLRQGSGASRGAERMLAVRPDLHRGLNRYAEDSLR